MGWYYNRGRGNLPLTLMDGRSISVSGNSWIELVGRDETTPSVLRAKTKRLLHRQDVPPPGKRPVREADVPSRPVSKAPAKKVKPAVEKPSVKTSEAEPPSRAKVAKRRKTKVLETVSFLDKGAETPKAEEKVGGSNG